MKIAGETGTRPEAAAGMRSRDPVRTAVAVGGYLLGGYFAIVAIGVILFWIGGPVVAVAGGDLLAALMVNWLALRIYAGGLALRHLGLWWNRASADNLAFGLFGGMGAACLVLLPGVIVGVAHFTRTPAERPGLDTFLFVSLLLAAGSSGEELFFRGFGFQTLLAHFGALPTIIPVGIGFALLHSANPNATWLALLNTAGFGILFGYAYLRSRDLWLPIGLHFGWNFTLPLFGVNVSGLRMKVTGYEMSWSAGTLWSGGEYGPEASILTSAMLLVLFFYLWKAPIHRQISPLTDPPAETVVCEPLPPQSH